MVIDKNVLAFPVVGTEMKLCPYGRISMAITRHGSQAEAWPSENNSLAGSTSPWREFTASVV